MSYTFTSFNKNYTNNEYITNQFHRSKLDDIFTKSKSILMVGWRFDSDAEFVKYMIESGKELSIVEIFPGNLKNIPAEVTTYCDDILKFQFEKKYDLFLWQHGPEHVHIEDAKNLFKKIEPYFQNIIVETPYGVNHQGEMYGNVYEAHISTWYEEDYVECGFSTVKYAGKNHEAFIIGYKSL